MDSSGTVRVERELWEWLIIYFYNILFLYINEYSEKLIFGLSRM